MPGTKPESAPAPVRGNGGGAGGLLVQLVEVQAGIHGNRAGIRENRAAIHENRRAIRENRKGIRENRKAIAKLEQALADSQRTAAADRERRSDEAAADRQRRSDEAAADRERRSEQAAADWQRLSDKIDASRDAILKELADRFAASDRKHEKLAEQVARANETAARADERSKALDKRRDTFRITRGRLLVGLILLAAGSVLPYLVGRLVALFGG